MASFLLLLICLVLGLLIARFGQPPQGMAKSLNWWLLYVALPALVLEVVPHLQWDLSLWFIVASMWLTFFGGWLVVHWIGRRMGWPGTTIGALVLTAGLSNTAFVGFPLIEALRGKALLSLAPIADQMGSLVCANLFGSFVIAGYAGTQVNTRALLQRLARFPPLLSFLVAIVVSFTPGWPEIIDTVLMRISATLTPLALFAVGLQLRLQPQRDQLPPLLLGLGWKLLAAPLLVFALGWSLQIRTPIFAVSLLEAAMPPLVAAAILAEQGGLDARIANLMVGIGILVSFITVPLLNQLL